ncbi:MAG: NAD(+) kinase [Gammaproteobacteria bacterium]
MTAHFQNIGIISKSADPSVAETLATLLSFLEQRGIPVMLDESAAASVPHPAAPVVGREELAARCDLAIAVGGDGTLLNAARSLADAGVPLLGINRGRLGFLADVLPADMTACLDRVLAGHYQEEERTLLHAEVLRNGKCLHQSDALNDVVIHKYDIARMIELETHIDGRFLNTQRSDGLVMATPTGSTAYALSGGGPILHPTLSAIVLVPICPHTLTNRPIVINDHATIEVILHGGSTTEAQVTCDGQVKFPLDCGDRVRVCRKDKTIRLLHPPGHDHYEVLREKLRWG